MVNVFVLVFFFCVVAISNLVHDLEAIYDIC